MAKSRLRIGALSLICIGLWAAALSALGRDMVIAASWKGLWQGGIERRQVELTDAEKMDPPPGFPLPDTPSARKLRAEVGASPHGYIVVGMGSCMSCTHFEFPSWEADAKKFGVGMVAFSSGDPRTVQTFRAASRITTPIVLDPGDELGSKLNAYYAGRVYFFDRRWRLRWVVHGLSPRQSIRSRPDLREIIHESN